MASEMRNNGNKKHKINIAAVVLLFCLSALSSTAISFETQPRVLSSSGLITYPSGGTLHVTDSTPEGPVPYTIDGQSGYDTGANSYYNISAGTHTIELPSPYTSPISDITYYFSTWEDGSTDNPRTVTLEPDAIATLHGTYYTSPEPPPPPPPPPPPSDGMPTDYLAYSGFEHGEASFEENPAGMSLVWAVDGIGYGEVVSSFSDQGQTFYPMLGSLCLKHISENRYAPAIRGWQYSNEVYMSCWNFFPLTNPETEFARYDRDYGWIEFAEMRMNDESGLWLMIYQESPYNGAENMYWNFKHALYNTGSPIGSFDFNIYSTTYYEGTNKGTLVECNPMEVPLGRWFRLEFYIKLDTSNGIFTVWLTDPQNPDPAKRSCTTLLALENIQTTTGSYPNYWCLPKYYGMQGQVNLPKVGYSDEWYIYDYNAHVVQ